MIAVGGGAGMMGGAIVTNVVVNCSTCQFLVGGWSVSGLAGTGLVLATAGQADLPVPAGASTFAFGSPMALGSAYSVTVKSQPTSPSQTCTVGNGIGTMGSANVTNIAVTCAYTVTRTVVKGPVSGATVTAYAVTNGTMGAQVVGGTTDSMGNFSISIGDYSGPMMLQAGGGTYTEGNGQFWLNAYLGDNWNYAIALAKEIAAMGFDEVQLDYVRFPGVQGGIDYGTENTEEKRVTAIVGFLSLAQKELRSSKIFISADVFGLTTATEDDQHTGQRLRDLGPYLDYVSPMVYPDTWVEASKLLSRGLEIKNCTEAILCPYDVIFNSYKRATEKTSTRVRLWLQAYAGQR